MGVWYWSNYFPNVEQMPARVEFGLHSVTHLLEPSRQPDSVCYKPDSDIKLFSVSKRVIHQSECLREGKEPHPTIQQKCTGVGVEIS
jgi:hypothetical protein